MKRPERVAAVDKIEEKRKPEDFIGHRNRTRTVPSLSRATNGRPYTSRTNIFECRGGHCPPTKCIVKGERYMKATGIVRRVDE